MGKTMGAGFNEGVEQGVNGAGSVVVSDWTTAGGSLFVFGRPRPLAEGIQGMPKLLHL